MPLTVKNSTTYRNAHQWLGNANLVWKRLIGARVDTVYSNGYQCFCDYYVKPFIVSHPSQCVDANGYGSTCHTIPNIIQQTIEKPNDGVVTSASQTAYPGAKKIIRMDDTNHMQERNCDKTKDALNALFDGDHGAQFKLNKK